MGEHARALFAWKLWRMLFFLFGRCNIERLPRKKEGALNILHVPLEIVLGYRVGSVEGGT